VIVSVAHLDDEERTLVLGVLLEEILAYTRSLPGTRDLKAFVVFDEVYGLLPPHPNNPPTKRPTVALMKQGRAFGLGVIVATQNPMDLDYRALSNGGVWGGREVTDGRGSRARGGEFGERQ
jgi:DNA helicase HerA-like ATPase